MRIKFIITAIFIFIGIAAFAGESQAATATGTIESQVRDIGIGVVWGEMSWTASTSASSTIEIKVRTATTSDMVSAPAWDSCSAVANGEDISANGCVTDGDRYVQYYALLTSDYATTTEYVSPELYDMTIKYKAAGILVSSPYDTLADDTVLSSVHWHETRPAGTDVLIQLRSSADGANWTGWLGPDGTAYDFFTDPDGGEGIPSALSDGAGERYIEYRVILDSGGVDYPVLSDITLDFTADIPLITSVSPGYVWSNASGTVSVILSGSGFVNGASVSVESGGSSFDIADREVTSNSASINLKTSLLFGGPAEITITNPNGAYVVWNDFYVKNYIGTYISPAEELPNLYFNTLSWTATTSATSTISIKIRTAADSGMGGASAWADCAEAVSGEDISASPCVTDGNRYVQYRAELTAVYGTTTGYISPELGDITLGYARYAASGELISSPYDTGSAANAVRKIYWSETVPAGADVKFQLRTAPDADGSPGTWTGWLGVMGADSYYYNADGLNAINLSHNDGASDRWLQYRAVLTSDGALAPILSDITVEYGDKYYSTTIINDNAIFKDGTIFR
ncbi:MAG: hypothetical protein Q8N21_01810 [bacterium]|nr:hypothetical protein [bacterium]